MPGEDEYDHHNFKNVCGALSADGFCCSMGDVQELHENLEGKNRDILGPDSCKNHFKLEEDLFKLNCI